MEPKFTLNEIERLKREIGEQNESQFRTHDSCICRFCSGSGWVLEPISENHPRGTGTCHACKGTGIGESIETYWKRNGIVPKRD